MWLIAKQMWRYSQSMLITSRLVHPMDQEEY